MELLSLGEIVINSVTQLTPVWVALIITFFVSIRYKRSLGLYGKLFDSTVGMIGFALVMFWVCLLYTSPSPRDKRQSRMPSSA